MTKRQTKKVDSNSYLYSDIKKKEIFSNVVFIYKLLVQN